MSLWTAAEIAGAALTWDRGAEPVPTIEYTEQEHGVWSRVSRELAPLHERLAHPEYLAAKSALGLPTDHVPQLAEVTTRLEPITGWSYVCAPGLVPLRDFYADLGSRTFNSTQYLRHASEPLYTPEPDIIHEVIGHANQLASPRLAAITEAAGQASLRLQADEAMKLVADVFWFSIEFGVMHDGSDLKAYGAGILSSYGEIQEFGQMEIRELDLADLCGISGGIRTAELRDPDDHVLRIFVHVVRIDGHRLLATGNGALTHQGRIVQ